MGVNEDVATILKVKLDTSQLDNIKGIIPELDSELEKIKKSIEDGVDSGAKELSNDLLDYDKLFFDSYNHPYATGYSAQLWEISPQGTREFLVDNKAVSEYGYPYLDALETGTSKMRAKPFAIHARTKVEQEADKVIRRNIRL